jgi:uncharacterized protein (DUF1810 family)
MAEGRVRQRQDDDFRASRALTAEVCLFNLQRFVDAQDPVIDRVRSELRAGAKRSHWMWFVFPQIAGLGRSATAQLYAIASRDEARAYFAHPVLGARLKECTELVLAHSTRSAHAIFGSPDDLKFHSSMTLFHEAAPQCAAFGEALGVFFDGEADRGTLERLT